jgi:hypothetical protein
MRYRDLRGVRLLVAGVKFKRPLKSTIEVYTRIHDPRDGTHGVDYIR